MLRKIALFPALLVLFVATPALADPTISGASDVTVEATSSQGAYVSFSVAATDATDRTDPVTCTPVSASLFALGTTAVSCTSSDSLFSTSTATFNVIVHDTTAPSITPPADQTFATSTFPATPTLTAATATDLVDPHPTVTYSTTSFALGTTTVTWTATDASGNSAATTSQVIITDSTAAAPSPVTIDLQIYTSTSTLFSGNLTVSACPESPGSATSTVNGFCAVEQASQANGFNVSWLWFNSGAAFVSANGEGDWNNGPWYTTFSDNQTLSDSLSEHILSSGENLLISDGPMPLVIAVSTSSPAVNATTTVTVTGFNTTNFDFEPVAGAIIEGAATTTGVTGTVDISATTTDPLIISAQASGFLPSGNVTITATAAPQNTGSNSGGGGGGGVFHPTFNLTSALSYLSGKQNANGSFSNSTITDWTAIAFGAADPGAAKTKLKSYLLSVAPSLVSATDYERHAMALEALGINPYSGTATNYIAPIVAQFDGTQIGDANLDNDDIFGILALTHAGFGANDTIIQKEAAFVLSKQKQDGSWDESPDMTAAAIEALGPIVTDPQTAGQVLGGAAGYLLGSQMPSGGWSSNGLPSGQFSIDSTSWVQTAINGIIAAGTPGFTTEAPWISSGGQLPTDALASAQQSDGAVQPLSAASDTRVWSTSYAVVAASGKDWNSILQSFAQPVSTGGVSGGGSMFVIAATSTNATSTAATSTPIVATSTPHVASTTPIVLNATSTAVIGSASTTPAAAKPVKKVVAVHTSLALSSSSTPKTSAPHNESQAAAASIPVPQGGNVFESAWSAIVGFFSHWF